MFTNVITVMRLGALLNSVLEHSKQRKAHLVVVAFVYPVEKVRWYKLNRRHHF